MPNTDHQSIAFGPFLLNRRDRSLTRDGILVPLGGRAFDILVVLASSIGETVSKYALLDRVWPGLAIEENNLQVHISALRKALGPNSIINVPGHGYRLIAPSQLLLATAGIGTSSKPSIAVMPFTNLNGDLEQEYFVDGMVEEIITALSRIRWLFVIARNTSFIYKGKPIDVKQVAREIGARYVLEGLVRKDRNRIRVTAQLIDSSTGAHLWADRFDGMMEDVFDLQDKVASNVAGVIEPALQAAEAARSKRRPTNDLTAYDLYLRAYEMALSSGRQIPEALSLLEQAIERDNHYGAALAWAAHCCARLLWDGQSQDRDTGRLKGISFARRALEVAGDDSFILANTAQPLAYFGENIGAMIALVDRALTLNPNYARGWHIAGILRCWAGELDNAIECVKASMRLSPRARVGQTFVTLGQAHFLGLRFDEAVSKLLLAIQDDSSFPHPYRVLAACYAHMGRLEDARDIVARLRAITPVVMDDPTFLRQVEHRQLFVSGLRLALNETSQSEPDGAKS